MPLSNANAESILAQTYIPELSAAWNTYDGFYSSSTPVLQSIATQPARDAFFEVWRQTVAQYRRLTYSPTVALHATSVGVIASRYRNPINLLDGRVFIAPNVNGTGQATPLIYNPDTNAFSTSSALWPSGPSGGARLGIPCLLADGRVFMPPGTITGGVGTNVTLYGAVWDPVADTVGVTPSFVATATPSDAYAAPPILMPNGKVLCLGTSSASAGNRSRIYNPSNNTWEEIVGTLPSFPIGAAMVQNGNIIGIGTSSNCLVSSETGAELAVIADGTYTTGARRTFLVPDGRVIVPQATAALCRAFDPNYATTANFTNTRYTAYNGTLGNPTNYEMRIRGCIDITGRIWRFNTSTTTTSTQAYHFDPFTQSTGAPTLTYNIGGGVMMKNGKILVVPNVASSAFRIITLFSGTVPTIPMSLLCSPFINKSN